MSDTPRTDELLTSFDYTIEEGYAKMRDHARALERELNTIRAQFIIANEGLYAAYQQGHADGRDSRDPDLMILQCTVTELRNKLTIAEDNLHGLVGYKLSGPADYESMADFIEHATEKELRDLVAWTKQKGGE